jgi:hypothetical protein
MTSDEIKNLLSEVPRASMIPTPPDSVAILISNLRASDSELSEIREWVQAHGGQEERSEAGPSRGLRAGRLIAPPPRVEHYFAIPAIALH